jgi:hypothetical protein
MISHTKESKMTDKKIIKITKKKGELTESDLAKVRKLKFSDIKSKTEKASEKPYDTSLLGWKCPVCGRGNSPFNSTCPCVASYPPYTPHTPYVHPPYPYPYPYPLTTYNPYWTGPTCDSSGVESVGGVKTPYHKFPEVDGLVRWVTY